MCLADNTDTSLLYTCYLTGIKKNRVIEGGPILGSWRRTKLGKLREDKKVVNGGQVSVIDRGQS